MAEFGRCPTCDSPQPSTHPVVSRSVGGKITGLCPDPFHALRPESDLLDLVRQYGDRRATEIAGRGAIAAHARAEAETLFARIEAEIQRLGENDATGDLQAQRDGDLEPTAERIILRLRRQLSDAHAEVDRLKAELAAEEEYCGNLGTVLGREGSVTVEMAPPRESRTKVGDKIKRGADKVPADVKQFVDQRYLRVWSQHPADPAGSWGSAQPSVAWGERHLLDECAPLVVTEVFDA